VHVTIFKDYNNHENSQSIHSDSAIYVFTCKREAEIEITEQLTQCHSWDWLNRIYLIKLGK